MVRSMLLLTLVFLASPGTLALLYHLNLLLHIMFIVVVLLTLVSIVVYSVLMVVVLVLLHFGPLVLL